MSQVFSNMKSSCLGLLHIACVGQHSMTADTPRINSLCWGRIPTPCTHGPGLHIHDLLDFLHPQSHDTRMALRLLSICCSMTILPTQILFRLFCPAISRMCKLLSMTQIREAGPQFCGAAAIDEVYSSSWLLSLASALRTLMFSSRARSTIALRLSEETLCAISAAYLRLCMSSSSSSLELCTTNL